MEQMFCQAINSMERSRNFVFLPFLFAMLTTQAQFPQLHFENITTLNGLSNNEVTCFYQDRDGFLWIGTRFGLNRYDGTSFATFYHDPNNSNSLSGNLIVDIIQDHQGIFWIATKDGGLTRYDPWQPISNQFHQFTHDPQEASSIATNRLNCLLDYNDDYLFIGAEVIPGIFLNKNTFALTYLDLWAQPFWFSPKAARDSRLPGNNWIHSVYKESDSSYFISVLSPGWVVHTSGDPEPAVVDSFNIVADALSVPRFYKDEDTIWCASWNKGLYWQHVVKDTIGKRSIIYQNKFSNIDDLVTDVASFDRHTLMVATSSLGIFLVDKKSGVSERFTSHPGDAFSIASNKVNCVFRDHAGTWWVGTDGGISKYNPSQWHFNAIPIAENSNRGYTVFSVHEDKKGTIRICTSDGIYKKLPSENKFHLVTFSFQGKKLEPTIIYQLDTGEYILGTELSLFRYDPGNESIFPLPVKLVDRKIFGQWNLYEFETYQVRSIVSDSVFNHRMLWWAVLGWGLGYYDFETKVFDGFLYDGSFPNTIKNNLSHKIALDKNGELWLATADGLYHWKKNPEFQNSFDSYLHLPGDKQSLSDGNITDIFVDEKNHLWLPTNGGGLNEFDGKYFHCFTASSPISNSMYGIYSDRNNRFWIPSAAGFEVFDRTSKTFLHVNVYPTEWQLKLPQQMCVRNDGSFAYAANNSLISFNPDSVYFQNNFPKIYLNDFQLFNESILHKEKSGVFSFPYNKNFFTFYFSALELSQAVPVNYQYRLTGLNDKWIEAGKEGKADYTNLPPGTFSFEVKVTNALGNWSAPVSLVSFVVNRPFWFCWWFYVAVTFVIASVIGLVFNFRVRHFMKIQVIRNKIANDLHDDVGSALSTISLYSEVAKMKAGDSGNELSGILEKITATSQEMQENMNYIVWSIQPRHDRFDEIVQRMKSYAMEMLQPKDTTVNFVFDDQLHHIKLTQEKRKELFLIFKEAIHNITKYANCKSVTILFRKDDRKIVMEIIDDGIGFNQREVISGNGLHTMRERARTLKGDLKVSSRHEAGTTVLLTFPAQ